MIKWIIIIVVAIIILGSIKGLLEFLGQFIVTFFNILKNTFGIFLFLLLIVALYFHGTTPDNKIYSDLSKEELENYDPHFKCSMLIVDCEEKLLTVKSLMDGKIYTHEQKMDKSIHVDLINKYSRVVLRNPKCKEFEADTFKIGEIMFLDNHTYIDYKRDGQIFEYR
jgi:hypothetical protein